MNIKTTIIKTKNIIDRYGKDYIYAMISFACMLLLLICSSMLSNFFGVPEINYKVYFGEYFYILFNIMGLLTLCFFTLTGIFIGRWSKGGS